MTCRSRLCRSSPLEPWPAAPLAPLPFAGAMPFAPLPPLPFAAPAYVKIGPRLARSCVCVGVGSAPGNGSGVPSARLAVVRVCVLGGSGTSRWLIVVVCVVILIDEPFVCVIFRVCPRASRLSRFCPATRHVFDGKKTPGGAGTRDLTGERFRPDPSPPPSWAVSLARSTPTQLDTGSQHRHAPSRGRGGGPRPGAWRALASYHTARALSTKHRPTPSRLETRAHRLRRQRVQHQQSLHLRA
jgi:hypothetical protein